MDTSVSMLERPAGAPTDDDWRRLDELYRPLLRTWVARVGVPASDVDDLVQECYLSSSARWAGSNSAARERSGPGCGRS